MSIDNPVQKQTIKEGNGRDYPKLGQLVTIHYTGKMVDFGQKTFDSSLGPGRKPFQFRVGQGDVIRGLDEGIQKLSLGEKAWITMHHSYAYSEKGAPGSDLKHPEKNAIPPYANLQFKVHLLSIKN